MAKTPQLFQWYKTVWHTHLVLLSAAKQNYSISTGKSVVDGRICNELLTQRERKAQTGNKEWTTAQEQ